jgi:hypothetical protein
MEEEFLDNLNTDFFENIGNTLITSVPKQTLTQTFVIPNGTVTIRGSNQVNSIPVMFINNVYYVFSGATRPTFPIISPDSSYIVKG